MSKQVFNFNAGPSALPKPVLEKAQEELLNFGDSGMSVMELSHRSKTYEAVHQEAKSLLTELLEIPDNYEILFLQGGASLQFSMIPMNLLKEGKTASFVMSGSWSEKALKEAQLVGEAKILSSSKDENYRSIPEVNSSEINANDAYIHITSNNTIFGTQWSTYPDTKDVPLIADMSSDILSRPIDVSKFGMIYAGAQKNLGPSGVTVVIIRKDLLESANDQIPTILRYQTHAKADSLYHTPPTFAIYMLRNVLQWVKDQGGASGIAQANAKKAQLLYATIDESNGFYTGHATNESRSHMNVTFTLKSEELTKSFLSEAAEKGFVGLGGHRSVGGCRASIYNAVPLEACEALRAFMVEFQNKHA
ncbi:MULTISPECIES: 3-phosphoserine/phosphohydroxythreonine transaminase [Alkalihalophilus]|uniref:Phosphoserine aminotransferase n=1 Tax=Alkalihalophilus pseudofirmus (strain ATCC BAA-2126 / JCM 17055 / OF4) TaxID=398511 RepID=D3FVR9_ALKPO|nr:MULTISPECIES: 3-phosphoserine/phosphohydroxythreonine transaminase [Alkalihalophilus]ADC50351.1 phosphoserine aminotransferase [Alkalihalophilus pseudofirmus OF4]MEC2072074.1 3-phosphoserine/phosphohydroxythreonine transaminase [Alkalihalophilus marmarensis]